MADAGFSFPQFLFISEFQKLQIILLLKRHFMHRGNFLSFQDLYELWIKLNTFNWLKMLDPRWWMVSVPSLITNDFVMTSLLLLKIIVLVNTSWFYCRHLFLTLFRFMATLRGILILPLNSAIWRQNDVKLRYCVNQVNYFCLDDGNDECIILCNFVGRDWSLPVALCNKIATLCNT